MVGRKRKSDKERDIAITKHRELCKQQMRQNRSIKKPKTDAQVQQIKLQSKQNYLKRRSDPEKLKRENEKRRERRKRKREETDSVVKKPSLKKPRLNHQNQPSTSQHIASDNEPIWAIAESAYFSAIADGPIHPCICCDRLWFKKSVFTRSKAFFRNKDLAETTIEKAFFENVEEGLFCSTCLHHLNKKQLPPLARCHGYQYPPMVDCLSCLEPLEERMVSLRIPFATIRPLNYEGQLGIRGSIVNVPIEMQDTVGLLPKNIHDIQLIHVSLKRRLKYKSHFMYRLINPHRVLAAAEYLIQTPLYQSQNAGLDLEWFQKFKDQSFDESKMNAMHTDEEDDDEMNIDDEDNIDMEDENPPTESVISRNINEGLILAPGENKTPASLVYDEFGEELSFPKIYCGKFREFTRTKPPSLVEIYKSELCRRDRRGAIPEKILYNHQRLLQEQVLSAINISCRQKVFEQENITAANLQDEEFVKNLQFKNLAFKCLKNIKSSPSHWQEERAKVCAQIRQFGFPSIFLTVSAAENRWYDLIKILVLISEKRELTLQEFYEMTSTKKNEFIAKDPVTCARYFDHKIRCLWRTFECKEGPFKGRKITHYYYRVEFQQRGSPHYHVLLWFDQAPRFDGTNFQECIEFIDSIIDCSSEHPFASVQRHKHTFTCTKVSTRNRNNEYCRFNIPFFPMDETRILLPIEDESERAKDDFKLVRSVLEKLEKDLKPLTFEEFLQRLDMSLGRYLKAIRSGINRPTVVLKREVKDILTNNYSSKILSLMQSNIDIQFILDEYAVVAYLVDYINKPCRGLSKQMRACIESISNGNVSLRSRLKEYSNSFINSVEITAQEASWSLLELPMSKMSEDNIFIPTFPIEERIHLMKSKSELSQLNPRSRDVCYSNIIDSYVDRPHELENVCLAYWAAWYECGKKGNGNLKLLSGKQCVKKRTKPKVIRFRKYKKSQHEHDYYREQVLLYTHWRNEEKDILQKSVQHLFEIKREEITSNRQQFIYNDDEIDLEEELIKLNEMQREQNDDENEDDFVSYRNVLVYDENELYLADIGIDMAAASKKFEMFLPSKKWPDVKYVEMTRLCNGAQRDYTTHLRFHLRNKNDEQLYVFIQGAAGTGKSFLIALINQTFIRFFEKSDQDPSKPLILLMAPTGKAASNIKGDTIHSSLGLALSQKSDNAIISASTLNDYRVKYRNVGAVIIDEISMVGYRMNNRMNEKMQSYKANQHVYGNVHVFMFGDFFQLPPVKDSLIFKRPVTQDLTQLEPNIWDQVWFYKLTEIMRQKDDKAYAELLNRLAVGNLTEEDVNFLKSKETTLDKVPPSATLLFFSNKEVDEANVQRLNTLPGELVYSKAYNILSGMGTKAAKRDLLEKVENMQRRDTGNLASKIALKIGAKYMLVSNVETSDGLVNGVVGILKKIEYCDIEDSDEQEVKRIWLQFPTKDIGKELRAQTIKYAVNNHICFDWTPINRIKRVIQYKGNKTLSIARSQIPVILAEAMTIHKSQGATFDIIAVGMSKNMSRQLQYVALSRVTSADGLHILNGYYKPVPVREDDPIINEMKRLEGRTFVPRFRFLRLRPDPSILQIMYHNVQSLHAHHIDIKPDGCFMKSDILLFAETWTKRGDTFDFKHFDEWHVESSKSERKPGGVSIYIRKKLTPKVQKLVNCTNRSKGIYILTINFKSKLRIAVIYAKPGLPVKDIEDQINKALLDVNSEWKTVLVGDFNIEMNSDKGKQFCETLSSLHRLQLRSNLKEYTTEGNTTIDAIFSTHSLTTCGMYEAVYSYHLPMYIHLPLEDVEVPSVVEETSNDDEK